MQLKLQHKHRRFGQRVGRNHSASAPIEWSLPLARREAFRGSSSFITARAACLALPAVEAGTRWVSWHATALLPYLTRAAYKQHWQQHHNKGSLLLSCYSLEPREKLSEDGSISGSIRQILRWELEKVLSDKVCRQEKKRVWVKARKLWVANFSLSRAPFWGQLLDMAHLLLHHRLNSNQSLA